MKVGSSDLGEKCCHGSEIWHHRQISLDTVFSVCDGHCVVCEPLSTFQKLIPLQCHTLDTSIDADCYRLIVTALTMQG